MNTKYKIGYIYKHKIIPTGKEYIGKTVQTPSRRFRKNGIQGYKGSTKIYNSILKYGWDNVETEILFVVLDLTYLGYYEEYFMKQYNTIHPKGLNLNALIDNKVCQSEETKKKIGERQRASVARRTEPKIAWNRRPHQFIEGIEHKQCSDCKKHKTLDNYHNSSQTWDKLARYCKPCAINYLNKTRPKKPRLSKEEWDKSYELRKEKMRAGVLQAYVENPELRKTVSENNSKAVRGINPITKEVLRFTSGVEAQKVGFYSSNISRAIKYETIYKGYRWYHD